MHIGIDMIGTQTPGSRNRGIGRYSGSFAQSIVENARNHQITLIYHEGMPIDPLPVSGVNQTIIPEDPSQSFDAKMEAYVRDNPIRLDAYVLTSPMEAWHGFRAPAKPIRGMVMAGVCYDLIPVIFQERYLYEPQGTARFYKCLQSLMTYDRLLCISEATRKDVLDYFQFPASRAVNVSTAIDHQFFVPGEAHPYVFERLGIVGPYLLSVTGMDSRKNYLGVITAFGTLPRAMREKYQLVLTCKMTPHEENFVMAHAEKHGVKDRVILTNFVTDRELRDLYRGCELFLFPSTYEGFGLPILEAMSCGAPVMGGNNSSQIELVKDVGVLVNASDDGDLSEKLLQTLSRPHELKKMRQRSLEHAKDYRWSFTAERTLDAVESAYAEMHRKKTYSKRPALAIVSPVPPKPSGIADYIVSLAASLEKYYRIDFYHDSDYRPHVQFGLNTTACFDYRLLAARDRAIKYHNILYQFGNSHYHGYMQDLLKQLPGVVTLHDYYLGGEHFMRLAPKGEYGVREMRRVMEAELAFRKRDDAIPENMAVYQLRDWGVENGLTYNLEVLQRLTGLVVHSRWTFDRVMGLLPGLQERTALIPHGARVRRLDAQTKREFRERFRLSPDTLIIGAFGMIHPTKMNLETLHAFEPLARVRDDVQLIFVGRYDHPKFKEAIQERGLQDRIRMFENCSEADFQDLIAVTDLAVNLRRPPTNGESSGSLFRLLAHGVPTIVSDVGTFTEVPANAVVRLPFDGNFQHLLTRTLFELAFDDVRRHQIGQTAQALVDQQYDWDVVAEQYAAFLDQTARSKSWVHVHRADAQQLPAWMTAMKIHSSV